MIEVIDLCKSFGDLSVLKGINLKIEQGEKVVIIGPSGSGKRCFVALTVWRILRPARCFITE